MLVGAVPHAIPRAERVRPSRRSPAPTTEAHRNQSLLLRVCLAADGVPGALLAHRRDLGALRATLFDYVNQPLGCMLLAVERRRVLRKPFSGPAQGCRRYEPETEAGHLGAVLVGARSGPRLHLFLRLADRLLHLVVGVFLASSGCARAVELLHHYHRRARAAPRGAPCERF